MTTFLRHRGWRGERHQHRQEGIGDPWFAPQGGPQSTFQFHLGTAALTQDQVPIGRVLLEGTQRAVDILADSLAQAGPGSHAGTGEGADHRAPAGANRAGASPRPDAAAGASLAAGAR